MNKIFSDIDNLLDEVHSHIYLIQNKYSKYVKNKIYKYMSKEEINIINEYIEKSTIQIIKLDSILSDDREIMSKRKQYIIAIQNYITQFECLKNGEEYVVLLSNVTSDREKYLPENRDSDYALYNSISGSPK
uniref:BAG domain-containing protein n=1 Tax=Pithovirus LCPAC102 TaxID=2506587 RepID=A0A481Z5C3_9VIRU|nr:MAG: hypothetical protein LCPAC102_02220 [Pithovirus LCPAC102]